MTLAEIDAGLNAVLGVAASIAVVIFAGYWRERHRCWTALRNAGLPHAPERFAAWMMCAITVTALGAAVLSGVLTPYYFARAAGRPELFEWARELIPVANLAKLVSGIGYLMHARERLQRLVGAAWPFVVVGIAAATFLLFGLSPRLL